MPRMYIRPESGNRSNGRYKQGKDSGKAGIRKTHADTTSYFQGRNSPVIRRAGSNDVRGYNDIGRAFRPFDAPEDLLTPRVHVPLTSRSPQGKAFPLKSNNRTIPEFKEGVPPGSSRQMRLSDRKEQAETSPEEQTQHLNAIQKASDTLPPPEVALGDKEAIKDYLKPNSDTPPPLEVSPLLTKEASKIDDDKKTAPAEAVTHIVPEEDKNLPALIERNDYLPDGSVLEDRKTGVYENTGFATMHHKMGADIFKMLNQLEPFIGEVPGEIRSLGQVSLGYHEDFKAAPTNPLRLFLKSKNFDTRKIDDLLKGDRLYFRNNDYSLAQVKAMDELIKTLEPLGEEDGEFERFLKIVPEENRKSIKEPYDLYTSRMIKALRDTVTEYKKEVKDKPQDYVRRVLLDHENTKNIDRTLNDLGTLEETKNVPYLLDHHRNVSQAGNELLKVLRSATSYSQGTVFTHPELLKYTSEIPPMAAGFMQALKRIGDDPRINKHPQFVEKYSDVIFAIDRLLQGPLRKDMEIWHVAAKQANPIPTNQTYQTKPVNIMNMITPNTISSSAHPTEERVNSNQMSFDKSFHKNKFIAPTKTSSNKKDNADKTPKGAGDKKPKPVEDKNYLKLASTMPQPYDLVRPLGAGEQVRPAPFDDPFLRETQNLAEWSDYASKMKAKLDTLNQIGNTIQEMTLAGTSRPDPEYVALKRRTGRLGDLNNVIKAIPQANKMTSEIEQGTIDAQQKYVEGVGKIMASRLKLQAEEANQRANLDQMAAKSATGLAAKNLETSLELGKLQEKLYNTFLQKQAQIDANTWGRIKSIVGGFKY